MQYSSKILTRERPKRNRSLHVSSVALWKVRKGVIFLVDLKSIEHKLFSYSLNASFSRRFPQSDGPSISPYKLLRLRSDHLNSKFVSQKAII